MSDGTPQTAPERDVATRIGRYARLRAVERALQPSVRRRFSLGGASARQDLVTGLQRLPEGLVRAGRAAGDAHERLADAVRVVDHELDTLDRHLANAVRDTPLSHFRSTLPHVVDRHRNDAAALLDFWLGHIRLDEEPIFLVDYLITLLATEEVDGRVTLVHDPATVTDGVDRACSELADDVARPEDLTARDVAEALRASSVAVLAQDDLQDTIVAMRELKVQARARFFDRDFLRSVVQYNATVKNRFAALAAEATPKRGVVDRTLEALRALDAPPRAVAPG